MSRFVSRFRTPIFSNTGSTARDHLASERTFLAWIRTGLGFIALGIAVERFSQLDLEALTRSIRDAARPPTPETDSAPSAQSSTHPSLSAESRNETNSMSKHEALLVPALLGTGTGSIVYGTTRYFTNLRLIERGLFTPAFHGVSFLSVSCAAMAGAAYWGMLQCEQEKVDDELPAHPTARMRTRK